MEANVVLDYIFLQNLFKEFKLLLNVTSPESPVGTQEEVIPQGAGNVQFTDRWETSPSEAHAYRTSTEMLQRARLGAPLTHQVQERPELLRRWGGQAETPSMRAGSETRSGDLEHGSPRMSPWTESPPTHRGGGMCTSSASPPGWQERGHTASTSGDGGKHTLKTPTRPILKEDAFEGPSLHGLISTESEYFHIIIALLFRCFVISDSSLQILS